MPDYDKILSDLKNFIAERDWEQYHSPKNLSMALSGEISEIIELFQWKTTEESYNVTPEDLQKIKEEIGDVQIYLMLLASKFGINTIDAASEKMKLNGEKYPVQLVKGKNDKYTKYQPLKD